MTPYLRDLTERVLMTFAGGFLAGFVVDATSIADLAMWQAAALSGVAAVVSLLKGLAARRTGSPDSAGIGV